MKYKKQIMAAVLIFCMTAGIIFPGTGGKWTKAEELLLDGMAGYWKFDGETQDAQLENLASESSLTASKTGSGVSIKQTDGVSGGTAYFSKQDASYLKLDLKAAGMGLNVKNQDFSIAAWIKLEDGVFSGGSSKVNIFQQTSDVSNANASGRTILYCTSDRKLGTYLAGSDVLCNRQVAVGEWFHVVFTISSSAKKAQFYVNGRLEQESTLSGDFVDAASDIMVGAHKNPTAQGAIKGNVDELRYYNKVISADAVKAMFDEFGADLQLDALKEALRQKVTEALALSGGSEEAKAVLVEKAEEATELLEGTDLTAERLQDMLDALEQAMQDYKNTVLISIEVDTSRKLRDISPAMFGINHRYHNDGYSSWNAEEGKIEEEFDELVKEAAFGSIRYPGGTVSNLYDWKRAIGPVAERKKTIHGNLYSPITPNFGVDEAMTWIYDELNSETIWVYAMGQGSADDAADLFEYLNAPADGDATNPNGGTDWAEVRAANGHPEPYGVTQFEIGNEMGLWGQNYWMPGCGASDYASMARAYVNGGEMTFNKQHAVQEEDWQNSAANSNGSPNQVRYALYAPVVEGSATIYVNDAEWEIVPSLKDHGDEAVCEFDEETGKITFGDGTNGKIPPSGQAVKISYKTIRDGFVAYYDKLKEIAEELDMDVSVYSCMEKPAAITALKNAGNKYDGAVIHPYSETSGSGGGYISISESDPQFYEKLLGRSLEHNISRVEELIDIMGEGKVPVVSEFGIYRHNSAFIRSIGHAIYIANEMIDYIGLGTPYLNKHCLVDYPYKSDDLGTGSQCVIQAVDGENGEIRFVSTPSAKAFSIFNRMTGDIQVDQTLRGNSTYYTFELNGGSYEVPVVKVLSTKDEEGNVYVTAVNNRKNDTTRVEIGIDDRDLTGSEVEVWHLTSEGVEDENTIEQPSLVDVEKNTVTANGNYLEASLAPHSITSFKIPAEQISVEKAKVTLQAEEGGTVSENLEVEQGSQASVTAYPKEGYEFAGWYLGEEKVSDQPEYQFTVTEDVTLTAKFAKKNDSQEPGGSDKPGGSDQPGGSDKPGGSDQPGGSDKPGDSNKPGNTNNSGNGNTENIRPGVGEVITDGDSNGKYKVVSIDASQSTVAFYGMSDENQTKCVVPETVNIKGTNYKVTAIEADAFKNKKKLSSVVIGSNVKIIGESAFSGCSGLKTVTIGKNLTEIQEKAFYKATSLTKIIIPANVKKIGKQAFSGAKKLKNIVIKTKKLTMKSVGKNAFQGVSKKVKFSVPKKKKTMYKKLLKTKGAGKKAVVK